ncbi:MAG: CPBP family intramembrane metalloprotease [Candidatus Thermoplasmatota archaeon]|nr:CPBP family intramembrane metalloprotease [Candidatus Thermoplasmatota archaeon]
MSPSSQNTGIGTQEQMRGDPKWNGVPPVGDRPIDDKWKFLGLVALVFLVKIVIWGAYRFITGSIWPFTDPAYGNEITYWAGTVLKPLFQLGPVFLLWWFVFKERGLPFRFTKKNIASSLFWGLLGAVLFFAVSTTSMTAVMNIMGYGSNFRIVAGWDDVGWHLIIAMMFSYMIGTGPAEEIFSRGFLQDQTARAHPIWFAIVFSAVLFAVGHLPISIFMHHMSFEAIVWYMLILFVMGVFFSLIYQWSRNILLPILIHGLWDWYLSLFSLKGDYSSGFLANAEVMFMRVDFFNTLITLAIMLPFFYILYRMFWRRDMFATGAPFEKRKRDNKLLRWIRDRDQGHWPKRPWFTVGLVTLLFCFTMLPAAAMVGVDDPARFSDGQLEYRGERVESREWNTQLVGSYLGEGQTETVLIDSNGTKVTKVNVSLQWSDEPDAGIRYTNLPDTFTIDLLDGSGEKLGSQQGTSGRLSIVWVMQDESVDLGNLSVNVKCYRAGDQEPMVNLLGLRTIADNGNDFNLRIDFETLYVKYEGESEGTDVRW